MQKDAQKKMKNMKGLRQKWYKKMKNCLQGGLVL